MSGHGKTWSGLELMVDREPCEGDCPTCELFLPLTPERLVRIARQLSTEEVDDDR